MRRRGLATGTITRRRDMLQSLAAHVEPSSLLDVDAETIESFLDARPIGARTRYHWLTHFGQFYEWAKRHGHTQSAPTDTIDRPKTRPLLPRPISDGDLVMALEAAPPLMYEWLVVASYAGLRVSELAGLTVDNVLERERALRVLGKGSKERIVPMHPKVEAVMLHLPTRGHVWRRPTGHPWTGAMISRNGSAFYESLGIAATLHMNRHWFGTKTYAACKDLRVVQELMGHADISTTAGYAAFSKAEARRAVLGIDDVDDPSLFAEFVVR